MRHFLAALLVLVCDARGDARRRADGDRARGRRGAGRDHDHGDRLFTTEMRGSLENIAVVARDPEPHDVTGIEGVQAAFAGAATAASTCA